MVLDLKGLKCPLPVLKTRAALNRLAPGQELGVLATDPMAAIDIPHFVHSEGHSLLGMQDNQGVLVFTIRKGNVSGQ